MDGPNFDPRLDEEVRVKGENAFPGVFKIIAVHAPYSTTIAEGTMDNYSMPVVAGGGGGTVDLERISGSLTGNVIRSVPWDWLDYVDKEERKVRRTIEWLKTSPDGRQYPDYIVDYEVKDGEDHVGNPSIFVRFFIDPDYLYENGRASDEKVIALNEFLDSVRDELFNLELNRWISVRVGEARRTLDVAS